MTCGAYAVTDDGRRNHSGSEAGGRGGVGRRFYEKFGGRVARTGTHTSGAYTLPTVGCGWQDIEQLRGRLKEG